MSSNGHNKLFDSIRTESYEGGVHGVNSLDVTAQSPLQEHDDQIQDNSWCVNMDNANPPPSITPELLDMIKAVVETKISATKLSLMVPMADIVLLQIPDHAMKSEFLILLNGKTLHFRYDSH